MAKDTNIADNLLKSLEFETMHNILESFIDTKWDPIDSINTFMNTPTNARDVYYDIVARQGVSGIKKILGAIDFGFDLNSIETTSFAEAPKIIDGFLTNFQYPNLQDASSSSSSQFNFKLFNELAKSYKMPISIYQHVINDIVPQIDFQQKMLETVLVPQESMHEAFLDLGRVHTKANSYAVLLKPEDPSGLFIGKMTASCMHVAGATEDTAVVPAYTSRYAGFIAIQIGHNHEDGSRISKSKVKAGCYVWMTEDADIVIDSFEYKAEGINNFLPFIERLSTYLDAKGVKLFIGTGGETPKILVGEEELTSIPRPSALDSDTSQCDDSEQVYEIKPGVKYTIDTQFLIEDEEKPDISLDTAQKIAILSKISENAPSTREVIKECLKLKISHDLIRTVGKDVFEDTYEKLADTLKLAESLSDEEFTMYYALSEASAIFIEKFRSFRCLTASTIGKFCNTHLKTSISEDLFKILKGMSEPGVSFTDVSSYSSQSQSTLILSPSDKMKLIQIVEFIREKDAFQNAPVIDALMIFAGIYETRDLQASLSSILDIAAHKPEEFQKLLELSQAFNGVINNGSYNGADHENLLITILRQNKTYAPEAIKILYAGTHTNSLSKEQYN